MNGNFESSLSKVLVHEGGYVNNPKDPGGETNKGVTKAVYDSYRRDHGAPVQSVRLISDAELGAIYKSRYWDKLSGDLLPSGLDYAAFDFAVNSGVDRAAKYLQSLVGAVQDGKIGPRTIAAIEDQDAADLVDLLCDKRLAFLRSLPTWATFGKGWASRVASVRAAAMGMAK